jgi:type I restriction enzyme R subunit
MRGRGARTMLDTDFQGVTPDATSKERFIIVDAVGVTEHDYVDASPLDRNKVISLERLLERAANFSITADEVTTLGSRLARLERILTPREKIELTDLAGMELRTLTKQLVSVADPDVLAGLVENAPTGAVGQPDAAKALRTYVNEVVIPLAGNPALRQRLTEIRALHDRVIDEVSIDALLKATGVVDDDKARNVVTSWKQYLEDNKDEITLIHVLYSQQAGAKVTFRELSDLADRIAAPPRSWSIGLIWNAYRALEGEQVRKSDKHTATDLISLIRFTLEQEHTLVPFGDLVEQRYEGWLDGQQQDGVTFTEPQMWWIERIKDTIVQSAQFGIADLELAPFSERGGVDGISRDLGSQAQAIIDEMNKVLAA